jgi:hypothetical protein
MSIQEKNQNLEQVAVEQRRISREIVAARRPVSNEDQFVLQSIYDFLYPMIRKAAHVNRQKYLGATVVGFGRFDQYHREFGPPTREITEQVESTLSPIRVGLGKVGIYGTDTIKKLGISLISDELTLEKSGIETAFEHKGFPLLQGPYRAGGYVQHVSIGYLDIDRPEYFRDPEVMERLDAIPGRTPSILLDPVRVRDQT